MARENGSDSPRSTERLLAIMEGLAKASTHGLRLTDIVEATGLGKATAHRLINGLVEQGLVDYEGDFGRYFMGMKVLSWAGAARNRFSLARIAEPALLRIAEKTEDTVYLVGKSGNHVVCLDCKEGSFPIKVLTLSVGDSRPLGIGAGSLAILAGLPDHEVEHVFLQQAKEREPYTFSERQLREMVERTRQNGYAFNDVHVLKNMSDLGMAAVGVPVRRQDGSPIAALQVAAVSARMDEPRQLEIVEMLQTECRQLESSIQPLLDQTITRTRTSRIA